MNVEWKQHTTAHVVKKNIELHLLVKALTLCCGRHAVLHFPRGVVCRTGAHHYLAKRHLALRTNGSEMLLFGWWRFGCKVLEGIYCISTVSAAGLWGDWQATNPSHWRHLVSVEISKTHLFVRVSRRVTAHAWMLQACLLLRLIQWRELLRDTTLHHYGAAAIVLVGAFVSQAISTNQCWILQICVWLFTDN